MEEEQANIERLKLCMYLMMIWLHLKMVLCQLNETKVEHRSLKIQTMMMMESYLQMNFVAQLVQVVVVVLIQNVEDITSELATLYGTTQTGSSGDATDV